MKRIGLKIKEIRTQKGLKQTNLLENNSQVVQIENGSIKRPTERTLRMIATGLDISFNDLIMDTDWKINERYIEKDVEYAISPYDISVSFDENLNMSLSRKYYPLYDSTGEKNCFCPMTGKSLIIECSKCERKIYRKGNEYCMGCGNRMYRPVYVNYELSNIPASVVLNDWDRVYDAILDVEDLRASLSEEHNEMEILQASPTIETINVLKRKMRFGKTVSLDMLCKDEKVSEDLVFAASISIGNNMDIAESLILKLKEIRSKLDYIHKEKTPHEQFQGEIYSSIQKIINQISQPEYLAKQLAKIGNQEYDHEKETKKGLELIDKLIKVSDIVPDKKIKDFISKMQSDNKETVSDLETETTKKQSSNDDRKVK